MLTTTHLAIPRQRVRHPARENTPITSGTGGDALAEFGLSHLGARVYDPIIGRFLSRDPLLISRTASSSNPYAFAANDPLNSADPTGEYCIGPQELRSAQRVPGSRPPSAAACRGRPLR